MNIGELIKVGRNQECPCGSGKKHKKCCLNNSKSLNMYSYEITAEPIPEVDAQSMSPKDMKVYDKLGERLYNKKVSDFSSAIEIFLDLKKKYPKVKRIYNLLAVCYEKNGQSGESSKLNKEMYEMFPEYLFAKINYVSHCMHEGDYDKFKEVFKGCYDLKAIYPERDKFHLSEAFSFFVICGRYFGRQGKKKVAQRYLNMATKLKPGAPELRLIENEILLGEFEKLKSNKFFKNKLFS